MAIQTKYKELEHPLWQYLAGAVTMLCVSGTVIYATIAYLPRPLGSIAGAFLFYWLFWLSDNFFIEPLYTLGLLIPSPLIRPLLKLVFDNENQKPNHQSSIDNAESRPPCALKMEASIDCIGKSNHKDGSKKPITNKTNVLLIFVQKVTSLFHSGHRRGKITEEKSGVNSDGTVPLIVLKKIEKWTVKA